jgi:hypothetical protein
LIQGILFLLLMMTSPVWATTYYVDPTGSNSNNGTSEATPFLTVAHAVTTMLTGDTTYVKNGTYNEGLILFRRSGTQASPIKLLNYPGHAPTIVFNDPDAGHRIEMRNAGGFNLAIGWITVEGFEITNGHDGIKWYNLHDATIRRNWIHDNKFMGMVGGGTRILVDRNIVNHNGWFAGCAADPIPPYVCNLHHGLYSHGMGFVVTNNLFYGNLSYGITHNGSSSSAYDPTKFAGPEFSGAANWIVANNTFAYSNQRGAVVVWGGLADNSRYENNIFYENAVEYDTAQNGIEFYGAGSSLGITVRNNLAYASGSGGTQFIGGSCAQPCSFVTQSGNVTTLNPGFVDGGSNSLPASPDWRLASSSSPAIGMARVNEFSHNATNTVGAFDTVGTPIASITANKITLTFPMSNAVPIQNLSTAGVTVNCTVNVCPGTDVVSTVTRPSGTDSQVEITLSGITGNACVSHADAVTISYNSATGTWTGNDNIGPYPGLHQKIFSFTNIPVTNQCDGVGPTPEPGGLHIHYKFNEGAGTTAQDETANNLDCTFTNGPTWGTGKTGTGMTTATGTQQHCAIPWGSGVNPTTQSMTWAIGVFVPAGTENALRFPLGPDIGTNQRGYICGNGGTWKMVIQSTSCTSTPASNLAITSGWNHLVARWNSGTDTVTLYKDGVAGNGGAVRTYTSYTFFTDLRIGSLTANNAVSDTYDEFLLYTSLEDPAALFTAFQASTPPTAVGTLAQVAIQHQAVYLPESGGSPTNFGAVNSAKSVVLNGAIATVFQVHCEPGAACDLTAFKLTYRKNGSATRIQVPNAETADGIWMWGANSPNSLLNSGTTTTRLTGSCTVTDGSTQLTVDQVPSVELPDDGCVMLRYIVNLGSNLSPGDYFDLGLQTENGVDLTGGYDVEARITIIGSQASAGP